PNGAAVAAQQWGFIPILEILAAAKIAGQKKLEERPQVAQRILHGCAGEDEAALCGQRTGGLGVLAVRVLDMLRLIKHDRGKGHRLVTFDVTPQEGVACNDQAVSGNRRVALLTVGAIPQKDRQDRQKMLPRALTVPDQRGGTHDQGRSWKSLDDGK